MSSSALTGRQVTPIGAAVRGAAAGLAATLVLSALSRVLPGLWEERGDQPPRENPTVPENPEDPEQLRRWQAQMQSPAAFRAAPAGKGNEREGGPPGVTPAGALTQPQGPGPEGLAEQFAFKLASGVFERDISESIRPAGLAMHLGYGSAWGVLYGMIQGSYRLRPGLFGPIYGLVVYAMGPAFLVPAMKLMRPPTEEPPQRTSMLILGHIIYGMTVAEVFERLEGPRE